MEASSELPRLGADPAGCSTTAWPHAQALSTHTEPHVQKLDWKRAQWRLGTHTACQLGNPLPLQSLRSSKAGVRAGAYARAAASCSPFKQSFQQQYLGKRNRSKCGVSFFVSPIRLPQHCRNGTWQSLELPSVASGGPGGGGEGSKVKSIRDWLRGRRKGGVSGPGDDAGDPGGPDGKGGRPNMREISDLAQLTRGIQFFFNSDASVPAAVPGAALGELYAVVHPPEWGAGGPPVQLTRLRDKLSRINTGAPPGEGGAAGAVEGAAAAGALEDESADQGVVMLWSALETLERAFKIEGEVQLFTNRPAAEKLAAMDTACWMRAQLAGPGPRGLPQAWQDALAVAYALWRHRRSKKPQDDQDEGKPSVPQDDASLGGRMVRLATGVPLSMWALAGELPAEAVRPVPMGLALAAITEAPDVYHVASDVAKHWCWERDPRGGWFRPPLPVVNAAVSRGSPLWELQGVSLRLATPAGPLQLAPLFTSKSALQAAWDGAVEVAVRVARQNRRAAGQRRLSSALLTAANLAGRYTVAASVGDQRSRRGEDDPEDDLGDDPPEMREFLEEMGAGGGGGTVLIPGGIPGMLACTAAGFIACTARLRHVVGQGLDTLAVSTGLANTTARLLVRPRIVQHALEDYVATTADWNGPRLQYFPPPRFPSWFAFSEGEDEGACGAAGEGLEGGVGGADGVANRDATGDEEALQKAVGAHITALHAKLAADLARLQAGRAACRAEEARLEAEKARLRALAAIVARDGRQGAGTCDSSGGGSETVSSSNATTSHSASPATATQTRQSSAEPNPRPNGEPGALSVLSETESESDTSPSGLTQESAQPGDSDSPVSTSLQQESSELPSSSADGSPGGEVSTGGVSSAAAPLARAQDESSASAQALHDRILQLARSAANASSSPRDLAMLQAVLQRALGRGAGDPNAGPQPDATSPLDVVSSSSIPSSTAGPSEGPSGSDFSVRDRTREGFEGSSGDDERGWEGASSRGDGSGGDWNGDGRHPEAASLGLEGWSAVNAAVFETVQEALQTLHLGLHLLTLQELMAGRRSQFSIPGIGSSSTSTAGPSLGQSQAMIPAGLPQQGQASQGSAQGVGSGVLPWQALLPSWSLQVEKDKILTRFGKLLFGRGGSSGETEQLAFAGWSGPPALAPPPANPTPNPREDPPATPATNTGKPHFPSTSGPLLGPHHDDALHTPPPSSLDDGQSGSDDTSATAGSYDSSGDDSSGATQLERVRREGLIDGEDDESSLLPARGMLLIGEVGPLGRYPLQVGIGNLAPFATNLMDGSEGAS